MKTMIKYLTIVIFTLICITNFAFADDEYPTRMTYKLNPSENCDFFKVKGEYILTNADKQAAIDRINEIRLEACREGLYCEFRDPKTRQNVARNLTMSDYIPVRWSTKLEKEATYRAAEIYALQAHKVTSLKEKNYKRQFENLCGYSINKYDNKQHGITPINMYYGEKQTYINWINGTALGGYGHYEALIRPDWNIIALSSFRVNDEIRSAYVIISDTSPYFNNFINDSESFLPYEGHKGKFSQIIDLHKSFQEFAKFGFESIGYSNKQPHPGNSTKIYAEFWSFDPENIHEPLSGKINRNGWGKIRPGNKVTYTSSNTNIAEINNDTITFKSSGDVTITATVNGETYTDTITVGHTWEHKSRKAYCSSDGWEYDECKVCGEKKNNVTIPATVHTYGSYTVVRNATCTKSGIKTRECTKCGYEDTEWIDVIPHTWNTVVDYPATTSSVGEKHKECSVCKKIDHNSYEIIPKLNNGSLDSTSTENSTTTSTTHTHKWVTIVDRKATVANTGKSHIECKTCKKIKANSIKRIAKVKLPIVNFNRNAFGAGVTSKNKRITIKTKKISSTNKKIITGIQINVKKVSKGRKYNKTFKVSKHATKKVVKKLEKNKKYKITIRTYYYDKKMKKTYYSIAKIKYIKVK